MKSIAFVFGAAGNVFDERCIDRRHAELGTDSSPQVDIDPIPILAHDDGRPPAGTRDLVGHVPGHLETTRADARADRGDDRPTTHEVDGRTDHTCHDPSPARVDGRDVAAVRVSQQNGNAVRHANADRNSGIRPAAGPADDCICLRPMSGLCLHGPCAMNLAHLDDAFAAKRCEQFPVVAVARGERVIESCFGEQLGT